MASIDSWEGLVFSGSGGWADLADHSDRNRGDRGGALRLLKAQGVEPKKFKQKQVAAKISLTGLGKA